MNKDLIVRIKKGLTVALSAAICLTFSNVQTLADDGNTVVPYAVLAAGAEDDADTLRIDVDNMADLEQYVEKSTQNTIIINIVSDLAFDRPIAPQSGKTTVINGNGHTFTRGKKKANAQQDFTNSFFTPKGDLTIDNVIIDGENKNGSAVAINLNGGSNFRFINSTIKNHPKGFPVKASNIQNIEIDGCSVINSKCMQLNLNKLENLTIKNSIFTGNSNLSDGGALNIKAKNVIIDNTVISDNTTTGNGGGIAFLGYQKVDITNTVIKNNTSNGSGSGIQIQPSDNSEFNFTSGAIYGNKKQDGSADDIYVRRYPVENAKVNILATSSMSDGETDFSDAKWTADGKQLGADSQLTADGTKNMSACVVFGDQYVAQSDKGNYTTLNTAIQEADSGAVIDIAKASTGGGLDLTAADIGSVPITIDKDITINLNRHKLDNDGKELFKITNGATLTIKSNIDSQGQTAEIYGIINAENGKLIMDADVDSSGSDKVLTVDVKENGSFKLNSDCKLNGGGINVKLAAGKTIESDGSYAKNEYSSWYGKAEINIILAEDVLNELNSLSANEAHDDVTLIKNCGADTANVLNDSISKNDIKVSGLDNNSLWQKTVVGDDLVIRKVVIADGIYLDIKNGSDDNDGTESTVAVKTLNKAVELARAGSKPIYVLNALTADEFENADVSGVKLTRALGYSGSLINVATGKELTLRNVTVDGGSGNNVTASAPLITVSGKLIIDKDAVLQNNALKSGNGGAVRINSGAEVVMNYGTIKNNSAENGGGIAVYGKFEMNGGTIDGNKALKNSDGKNGCGGGIVSGYGGEIILNNSGNITGNTAELYGGGISLANDQSLNSSSNNQKFIMNGGTISKNTSGNSGGGLFVQMNSKAIINGGNFTENICKGGFFGGGAIYVNGGKSDDFTNGFLQIYNAEIADNTSNHQGSALASCPTSNVIVYQTEGAYIHDNKNLDESIKTSEIFVTSNSTGLGGYEGQPTMLLSPWVLGGGLYNWKYSSTDKAIPLNELHYAQLDPMTDYNAYAEPTNVEGTEEIIKVKITDNASNTRGGAIGSNGDVRIGGGFDPDDPFKDDEDLNDPEPPKNETTSVNLEISKIWDDNDNAENKRPESVNITVMRSENGGEFKPFSFVTLDESSNWKQTVEGLPASNGEIKYTYSVAENDVEGYNSETTGSSETDEEKNITVYKFTVKNTLKSEEPDDSSSSEPDDSNSDKPDNPNSSEPDDSSSKVAGDDNSDSSNDVSKDDSNGEEDNSDNSGNKDSEIEDSTSEGEEDSQSSEQSNSESKTESIPQDSSSTDDSQGDTPTTGSAVAEGIWITVLLSLGALCIIAVMKKRNEKDV